MTSRWRSGAALTAAAVGAILLVGATAAHADATITINGGNVPTTAAGYAQKCDANQGGGPYVNQDVWVFVLPGNHTTSGDFVSVTAKFDTTGDLIADVTKVITTDGGAFLNGGPETSKAYLATTAGWTLITASAVITGAADSFNLTHTCAAGTTTSSTPTPSPTPSATPSPTPSVTKSGSPSTSTTSSTDTSTTYTSITSTAGTPGGSLPVTGVAIGGIVLAGAGLIAAGTALVFARRRRDLTTDTPTE